MKLKIIATVIVVLTAPTARLSAQAVDSEKAPDTTAPALTKKTLRLFAPAQYDSVLSLVPAGDSIARTVKIVGIGSDEQSGDIIIISLDNEGNPGKYVYPVSNVQQKSTVPPPVHREPRQQKPRLEQNGRTWFIIESSLKSMFVYPGAYATAFPNAQGNTITGISLLTLGGALYGTYAFSRNMELGYGKVGLMNYGSTVCGLYYPTLLSYFLDNAFSIDEGSEKSSPYGYSMLEHPTPSELIRSIGSMLGFPLGIYLGSRWNIADKDDYGKVAVMEYFSQTFGGIGFIVPAFFLDENADGNTYAATSTFLSMCFLPGGFYAGYKIVGNKPISSGRGVLPWVTGSMGTATGVGLLSLFEPDFESEMTTVRLYCAAALLGYGFGSWLGLEYHESAEYSYWQTMFIGASSVTGAGVGLALPLLTEADEHQVYTIAAIIGGWTGFLLGERLSLSLFERSNRDAHSSGLRINIPGAAALPLLAAAKKNGSRLTRTGASRVMPVANVEWRF